MNLSLKGSEHMIWMQPTQLDQPVSLGPKLGPPGLPKDLRGPQKGLSGPKWALLGAPGVQKRSPKGPQHMILMRPTQAHCVDVFWMPVSPRTRPKGAQKLSYLPWGHFGPRKPKLGTQKAPEWPEMTHNYVSYPWEVF